MSSRDWSISTKPWDNEYAEESKKCIVIKAMCPCIDNN